MVARGGGREESSIFQLSILTIVVRKHKMTLLNSVVSSSFQISKKSDKLKSVIYSYF